MTAYYGKVLDDVVVSPTAPADPYPDQLWWNSTNNGLYRWQTPDWVPQGTSAVIGWDDIEGKPATFPPTVPISQANVSGLVPALAEKAPLASPVFTGMPTTPTAAPGTDTMQIASTAFVGASVATAIGGIDVDVSWDDVSGKPSTFPPTVPIAWTDVSGTPSTYPPTLPIAQAGITNLITDLSGKAPTVHAHVTGDVTGLDTALAGKATLPIAQADVTNLTTDLAGKVSDTGDTMTGPLTLSMAQSASAPSINFGTANTGVWGDSTSVRMGIGGVLKYTVGTFNSFAVACRTANGTAGAPGWSFSSDTDAGLWLNAAGDMRLAMAGADVIKWLDDKTTTFFGKGLFPVTATTAPINLAPGVTPSGLFDGDVWIHSTSGLTYRNAAATVITASLGTTQTFNGAKTFSVKPTFATSITTQASCNLPHGVTPTTPVNGDLWSETTGFYGRVNGATVGPFGAGGGGGVPSDTNPVIDGTAAPGVLTTYSRGDHVHPTDTTRVALGGDIMTGPLVLPSTGTQTASSLTFGTAGTGVYGDATSVKITTGGSIRFTASTTQFLPTLPFRHVAGTVGAPSYSFTSDTDAGFYLSAAGDMRLSMAAADVVKWLDDKSTTFYGKVITPSSVVGSAGFNIPTATSAPSSPVDGDMWLGGNTLVYRYGSTTNNVANLNGTQTFSGGKTFSAASISFVGATFSGKVTGTLGATEAGFNLGTPSTDPSTPVSGDAWIHSSNGLTFRLGSTSYVTVLTNAVQTISSNKTFSGTGNTISGKLVVNASAATTARLNIAHGTALTSGWVDGDIWSTSTGGFYGRVNGVTKNLSIHVGTTAPASPITNDLWLDIN